MRVVQGHQGSSGSLLAADSKKDKLQAPPQDDVLEGFPPNPLAYEYSSTDPEEDVFDEFPPNPLAYVYSVGKTP